MISIYDASKLNGGNHYQKYFKTIVNKHMKMKVERVLKLGCCITHFMCKS